MNKYTKLTEVFQTSSVLIIDQKQTNLENASQSITSRTEVFQTSSVLIIDQKQTNLEKAYQSITSRKDISSAAIGNEVFLGIFSTFDSLNYPQREKELKDNRTPNYSSLQITFKP